MRPKELRELTNGEISQKEADATEELFRVRLRKSTGQLESSMLVRKLRRDLARIKTIRHEQTRRATGE